MNFCASFTASTCWPNARTVVSRGQRCRRPLSILATVGVLAVVHGAYHDAAWLLVEDDAPVADAETQAASTLQVPHGAVTGSRIVTDRGGQALS